MDSFHLGGRLIKNRIAILKDLEPSKYWNYLYQEGIFDMDDMDEVKAEKTRKKKAEALLEKVERSGPEGIAIFTDTLRQIQPHLYDLLQRIGDSHEEGQQIPKDLNKMVTGTLPQITQQVTEMHLHMEPRPYVRKALGPVEHGQEGNGSTFDRNSTTGGQETFETEKVTNQDDASPEEALIIPPTDTTKLPPHIHPDSEDVYPMTAKPRGIALIINIEYFLPNSEKTQKEREKEELDTRVGSEKDLKALHRLFDALDFKVRIKRNLTETELLKTLEDVSSEDHSAYDCFVLCLMSHGKEGQFYCADGKTASINNITNYFINSSCVTLKGKPKLFFIQACRGNVKERGVVVDSPSTSGPQEASGEDDEDRGWSFSFPQEIVPNRADMLMAYSTVSGYASFRNPVAGSRFVRCLVEVFQERANHEDVLSMLTKVNDELGKMGEIDQKQVGQPTSTLRKKVFFWPGL